MDKTSNQSLVYLYEISHYVSEKSNWLSFTIEFSPTRQSALATGYHGLNLYKIRVETNFPKTCSKLSKYFLV